MNNVLTLVAPVATGLTATTAAVVVSILAAAGATVGGVVWLADGEACDIFFDGIDTAIARRLMTERLADAAVDFAVQMTTHRRKRLLVADMDSTIVSGETLDALAAFAGFGGQVAAITERAMRGEILYRDALAERVALLAGLDADNLEKTMAGIHLTGGAKTLVATMAANGAYTALVSGGFKFFTERVGRRVGFDMDMASTLEIFDGRLTGGLGKPIVTKDVKRATLLRLADEHGVAIAETLAVGDGANDLPMINAAGLGVAYRGKPVLRDAADARIDHADLTALLFFQGYARDRFVV